jgi:alpha-1,6-mannosyltransferase
VSLAIVNIAHALLLSRAPNATRPTTENVSRAIALLTASVVIFRAELVLLLGPLVLQALWQGWTTLARVVRAGLLSGITSLGSYIRI